jgi:hypothetical protein
MDFDPNIKHAQHLWATYIPGRRGQSFKTYANRGHALSSLSYGERGILYRYDTDKWVEVYRQESNKDLAQECYYCGIKQHEKFIGTNGIQRTCYLKATWVDKNTDSPFRVMVCDLHNA